jgi:hypothetical protein
VAELGGELAQAASETNSRSEASWLERSMAGSVGSGKALQDGDRSSIFQQFSALRTPCVNLALGPSKGPRSTTFLPNVSGLEP